MGREDGEGGTIGQTRVRIFLPFIPADLSCCIYDVTGVSRGTPLSAALLVLEES